MKKALILFFICICLASISLLSCGSKNNIRTQDSKFIKEGWVDDDTYRVTTLASPNSELSGTAEKKQSAKDKALKLARRKVMQKFVDIRVRRAKSPTEIAATGVVVAKKFKSTVRNGKVVQENYDDDYSCEITYEVKRSGLKKEVMNIK